MLLYTWHLLALLLAAVLSCLFSPAELIQTHVLRNVHGMEVHLISTGAVVQRLLVPDSTGRRLDVVTGFDDPKLYANNTYSPYFGAIIGRVQSRISNATFILDGHTYKLQANEYDNAQHGGPQGWSAKEWALAPVKSDRGDAARLTLTSPNGDQGFPHTVRASVVYILTPDNKVVLEFEATSQGATPIGMISHTYFNLEGVGTEKNVRDHMLFINASYLTPLDVHKVPYGNFAPVQGTAYDFLTPQQIGSRIDNVPADFAGGGYDVNYVLWGLTGLQSKAATHRCNIFPEPKLAATLSAPQSGLSLGIWAQTPGLEFYAGGGLDGSLVGKEGQRYPKYGALALEAETFPNFINEDAFAKCILRPGYPYKQVLEWAFYNTTRATAP